MGQFNAEELEFEPFIVTVKGGEKFELPSLGDLTFEQIEVLSALNVEGGLDEVRRIFEAVHPEFAARGLPKMGAVALRKMMDAWQADAGVSLGEFAASTNFSEANTGPQSKPTSSSGASAFGPSADRARASTGAKPASSSRTSGRAPRSTAR